MSTTMTAPNTKTELMPEGREDRAYVAPDVDICESESGYVLTAEMPGVTKDGLEILLENNLLTLVGHRREVAPPGKVLHRESHTASFRRVFELDPAIETAGIRAQLDQGILTLKLPKAEKVKPRQIKVD